MKLVAVVVNAAPVANENSDGIPTRVSYLSSCGSLRGDVTVVEGELASALIAIRENIGDDALLATRGPLDLRCIVHPQAAREEFTPSAPFLRYIDASRLSGKPFKSPSDDNSALLTDICSILTQYSPDKIGSLVEDIRVGFDAAVCVDSCSLSDEVMCRARGLPWQATDAHVAHFFAGLNIAEGGIALCLSAEGRRNGEALIRFENNTQRELALRRHRHFLLSRYIEVYRATAEDFLAVAAGSSSEAVDFVSRRAAMIVRMRGLPFDCTEDQIRSFFAEVDAPVVNEGGVLFVNRPDGRPTGDAFVLFEKEEQGMNALKRHRHTIGSRYVELFRSSQAEVQQVVKRSGDVSGGVGGGAGRRDCIRLRGLPYEARVEHVVEFLGVHSSQIAPQGVHMVFNSQGHPSGEAFIQMTSEGASAAVAASAHNKFMTIGKKQRYIEVFQCSPDEMNLMVAAPPRPPAPMQPTPPSAAAPLILPPHPRIFPGLGVPFGMPQYWPYPSPPVSPNMLLNTGGQILVTGLGIHVTPADIVAHFSANPDTLVESVEMVRWATATTPGEALVRIRSTRDPVPPPMSLSTGLPQLPLPFPLIHT
ncbi:hypothetical protein PMAYCL1PPCAC_24419 [Pristionchus mayeri]|uniref:RRM domain-containing protein n=1 Tax=Pristionchus mayeri TaxID=1317129 RepID=A0AAN5I7D1_9BILA|nr:hypothetical protein PMAYCL1PPCAC_24419 [Pristionchus mayeri]